MTSIVKIMHRPTLNSQIKLYYCKLTFLHIKKPYRMTSSLMKTGDWKIGKHALLPPRSPSSGIGRHHSPLFRGPCRHAL